MDRVFSVDEISDQFWLPPPANDQKMNRSESEWAFQRFLQEAEAEASSANQAPPTPALHPIYSGSTIPIDSDQYQELLRSRLNLACAAVALKKAPFVIGKSSAGVAEPESTSQGSADSNSFAQVPGKGSQHKDVGGGPIEVPSLPPIPKKAVAQTKQTTSGSSRDLSDDDEAEGENETTENTDPSDVKKVRRMLSNRESARRSRRRKQAHLTELETQVAQLRVENLSLSKLVTSISQKYNEAAVDYRVLKADIETLRAKVKMAEETVKRVTGMNQPPTHANPIPTQIQRAENFAAPKNVLPNPGVTKMGRTPSMQRVASLEYLQKKICAGINQIGSKQISDP